MILNVKNSKQHSKSIKFLDFDTSVFDRALLGLSGATDSAMILYLQCKLKPDRQNVTQYEGTAKRAGNNISQKE